MLRAVDRVLAPLTWIAGFFVVVLLIAGPSLIGAKRSSANAYGTPVPAPAPVAAPGTTPATTPGTPAPAPAPTPTPAPAPAAAGAAVFASAGCANCHTLKAANASGTIGPNLDSVRPNAATVSGIVRSGGGAMPSFAGKLSDAQIQAVAQYVASVAGG